MDRNNRAVRAFRFFWPQLAAGGAYNATCRAVVAMCVDRVHIVAPDVSGLNVRMVKSSVTDGVFSELERGQIEERGLGSLGHVVYAVDPLLAQPGAQIAVQLANDAPHDAEFVVLMVEGFEV